MKASLWILILMVGASFASENNTTSTTSLNSTGVTGTSHTVNFSTTNDTTNDKGVSSVTSPIITKTDNTTTGNAENTSSRTLTTDNTKGTTELTSKNINSTPSCSSVQSQNHILGFAVAAVVIFLAVVWSLCLYCWYRRKLTRVKSHYDAERAISMHEVNGRKVSDVKFSVGRVDKELSSVSRNVHSEDDEDVDRSSDLYDLTDPDYELAVGTKLDKAKKCYDNDEEDSEYDMLNDEEKMKNRESEYACAEFKTSGEDLDNDTYDTTETCNRIKCTKKHENCGEKHSAENFPNVNSSDETEPQNQTNEIKDDSETNNQDGGEENQEEENKNSEDKTTVKDLTMVDNKMTVEKKTAVEDTTSEDKKTVENQVMIENKTTNGDQIKSKDDATVGDSDGKINKTFEKSKTSELDDDAKCSAFDYELVKIIQTPNGTTENVQGRPTAV